MSVHFLVVRSDRPDREPWVYCVSEPESPYLSSSLRSHLEGKNEIILEKKIDATPPADYPQTVCPEHAPAVEAIAKLDEAHFGSRDQFHQAMAKLVELGMSIQRELDRKAEDRLNADVANGSR